MCWFYLGYISTSVCYPGFGPRHTVVSRRLAAQLAQLLYPYLSSLSNVAQHNLGCVGIASGASLAGSFSVSRPPPVLSHQAVTHASSDPLVESPRLGPDGGRLTVAPSEPSTSASTSPCTVVLLYGT